jgi:hypothetical protein
MKRSVLSVCCLTVLAGCSMPSDEIAQQSGEIRRGDRIIPTDASVPWDPFAYDAAPPACDPGKPVDPSPSTDASIDGECGPFVLLPHACVTREEVSPLISKYCGGAPGSTADWRPTPECKGFAGDLWVSCCSGSEPQPSYDAGIPVAEDASLPNWPTPTNCSLLRLGDDRTCLDSELLEREARVACATEKGELKSLTLFGGECSGGASAAEATCCFPTFF